MVESLKKIVENPCLETEIIPQIKMMSFLYFSEKAWRWRLCHRSPGRTPPWTQISTPTPPQIFGNCACMSPKSTSIKRQNVEKIPFVYGREYFRIILFTVSYAPPLAHKLIGKPIHVAYAVDHLTSITVYNRFFIHTYTVPCTSCSTYCLPPILFCSSFLQTIANE